MNTAMCTGTDQGVRQWWDADGGWSTADAAGTVLVIDSWLVDEGRVRGLDRHAERFGPACDRFSELGAEQTNQFLQAVAESLPARGRWFPRVELVEIGSGTRLRMWLRPAPPRTATVRLWTAAGPDRRRLPAVKGTDLGHLAYLRAAAATAGADEALRVSPEGHVLEGASTSIVWWRGDVLCGPPPGPGLLPGITRALLGEIAGTTGHAVVTAGHRAGSRRRARLDAERPARHPAGHRGAGPVPGYRRRSGRTLAVALGGARRSGRRLPDSCGEPKKEVSR